MNKKLQFKNFVRIFTEAALLFIFLLTTCSAFGQNLSRKSISGNVTDENGNPVVGVTVRVKSTTIGTTTDANGNYAIKVPESNTVLVFSSIGYVTQEEYIKGRSIVNITLAAQSNKLAETVVVGYGTKKLANLTGSVTTVNIDQIKDLPVGNLSAALRGSDLLTGVHIEGGESRPGNPGSLVIRNPPNASKDGGTNAPLYVIDDVVRTEQDFNLLDPSMIESISILKDASAAVFGARAALGVVVVRTKRGKRGKPRINYSSTYGVATASNVPKMMNGYQFANYLNDMNFTRGRDSSHPDIYTPDELAYFKEHNYDWFDMAWKPAFTTRQTLNVSGGGERATYFAGASYFYQNGNLDKIDYQRWTFRASSDINIANNLKLGLGLSGVISNNKQFFLKQGGEDHESDIKNLLRTPQFIPPYVNGLPVELPGANRKEGLHIFEAQKLDNYNLSKTTELNVNASLEYNFPFIKGLRAKAVFNKNLNNFWGKQYGTYYKLYQFSMSGAHNHIYAGDPIKTVRQKNGDRIRISPAYTKAYQFNVNLNYDRQFGKHHVSALALVEQSESYYESVEAMKEGVIIGATDYMRSALGAMTTTNSANESGTLSYVGRVDYNYAEKYLAEFSFRYDASTKFAPPYRWGFFPAVSAGWVISEENFFKDNISFINFLKLRGSVGLLGGDRTKAWSWQQRYTPELSDGAVFGGNGDRTSDIKLEKLPNPKIQWDNVNKFNGGLDATLLDNRLSVGFDYYFNHGYDLLTTLSASVPFTVGSDMPAENFGIINSFGYEVSLGWEDKISQNFSYFIHTNFSYENSKLIRVDVDPGNIGTWEDLTGTYTRNRGEKGYVYEGMFRSQEEVDEFLKLHPGYTIFEQDPKPGMLYYKDVRGPKQDDGTYAPPDGKITEDDDRIWIVPKRGLNKGISFGFKWKGLQLHVKTSFSIGGQQLMSGAATSEYETRASGPAFWTDHWTPKNKDAAFPNPYYHDDYDVTSAFWLRNSNSFSIDLIDLSYTFDPSLIQRLGINKCRIYFIATNPVHFYNDLLSYSIIYPEISNFSLGINLNL